MTVLAIQDSQRPEVVVARNNTNQTPPLSQTTNDNEDEDDEEFMVPILPVPLAIICCLLNFVIPGSGTIMAGCLSPCFANPEGISARSRCCSYLVVIGIGFLQLLMTACFLVGWIWSAIWGLSLIGTAVDYSVKSDTNDSSWREPFRSGRRRPRSNFIYPMRAPSDVDRDSPPPPYMMFPTPPPGYTSPSHSRAGTPDLVDNPPVDLQIETPGGHETVIVKCALCKDPFAHTDRRYLCRHCIEIICKKCFTKTLVINGKRKYTICDSCYEIAMQREPENG